MRWIVGVIFLLSVKITHAQDYGVQWVLGYKESVLDFRNHTLTNYPIGPIMPMFLTSANICDSSGNLLYYTNGIYIAGADGNQIENGDSINPCDYTNQWAADGLNIPQAALFLPMPGNSRYYYLFHFSNDTAYRPASLYYSIIDVEGDSGKGQVIAKNILYYYKTELREGGMTACKHANGRDWWIVIGDEYNTYYKFLLTPSGISDTLIQTIGPSYYGDIDVAYSKFSQDGSKYATSCYEGAVLIMDFDRCTGEFSNADTLFNESCEPPASCNGAGGLEFSPNGRFFYATNSLALNQFDLSAAQPQHDSVLLYQAASNDEAQMRYLQLAPNGKLYASCFNGGFYFIHAVNYPDLKGDSSDYVDTAFITLTTATVSFPNLVNYQLGALANSGCDTIKTGVGIINVSESNPLQIMPNPADKYVYVEMGKQGDYEFDLLNLVGQVIDRKETKQVNIFDTENLAGGVYLLKVVDKNTLNTTPTKKVIIQH